MQPTAIHAACYLANCLIFNVPACRGASTQKGSTAAHRTPAACYQAVLTDHKSAFVLQAEARARRDAASPPSADVQALIPEYRAALQQLRGQLDQARVQLEEAQADNKTLEQQVRRRIVRDSEDWYGHCFAATCA